MKKSILIIAFVAALYGLQAQTPPGMPDSARVGRKPGNNTDSVRNGYEIYQGGKGRKSKSMGDTLAPRQGRPHDGTQKSGNTKTVKSQPKYPR